ncbi:hypothetical protein [Virgisporangium ochraceum]|uniref:hypothetical protein n=1 Tax=Virgisporangium ochraceum TaxID=65505 RepID=UPI001940C008|nr:hypothetical protein [Virgisporangium ochraceum]
MRRPEIVIGVLSRVVTAGGFVAVHRRLGTEGWWRVARVVWTAGGGTTPAIVAQHARTSRASPRMVPAGAVAHAMRRSRIVPGEAALDAWAVLAAVEADPTLPRRGRAPRTVADVRRWLADAVDRHVPGRTAHDRSASDQPTPARPVPDALARAGKAVDQPAPDRGTADAERNPGQIIAEPPTWEQSNVDRSLAEPPLMAPTPETADAYDLAPSTRFHRHQSGSTGATTVGTASGRPTGHDALAIPAYAEQLPAGPTDSSLAHTSHGRSRASPEVDFPSTDWAGLPFLLATASAAGLPDRLLAGPAFDDRTVAWVVHRLGALISETDDVDPGLLALAGLHGSRAAAVLDAPEPTGPERAALAEIAADWIHRTAEQLGADDCPLGLVRGCLRRNGTVDAQPGWFEIHLPLGSADLVVRRAGLDLDPGWVPWLGAVVRYVYD